MHKIIVDIIISVVKETHPDVVPETLIYLALQSHGFDMTQFQNFISLAVSSGEIIRENNYLRLP